MDVYIKKPLVESLGDKVRISCEIVGLDYPPTFTLYYQIANEYADAICDEKSDAFLVGLLPHLLCYSNKDNPTNVYLEYPVSEKLLYNLTEVYIPALANFTDMYSTIKIHAKPSNIIYQSATAVGTGVSGGVDSFYTIVTHKDHVLDDFRLTHGLYINLNAEAIGNESNKVIFTRNDPMTICKKYGLEYLYMETNLLSIYRKVTDVTNIFMVTSCALVLQKMFRKYLISGAYDLSHFEWDAHNASNFDIVSVNCLGTEGLDFILTGSDRKRVDKLKRIADDDVVREKLFICSTPIGGKNCSACAKCTQTMLEYYVNGDRNKATDLFDWNYFDKNPRHYWSYIFRKGKYEHYDWPELQNRARNNGLKIPIGARLLGFIKFCKNGFKHVTKAGLDYRP